MEVAGNVGRALSELPGRVGSGHVDRLRAVELPARGHRPLPLRASAVMLNVTPDHLDRHGRMEEYARTKLRLFENQTADDVAVLNADDPVLRAAELPGDGRRIWFTREQSDRLDWDHARIRGQHNLENALAAAAAAEAVGASEAAWNRALRAFEAPAASAADGGGARRRTLRRRLQGHQPGGGHAGADGVRPRGAPDPGRLAEGRVVRAAGSNGRRGTGGFGAPDRGVRRRRSPRPWTRPASPIPTTAPWRPRCGRPPPLLSRATRCCCRRPPPASTSSATTSIGARSSRELAREVPVGS